MPASVPRQERHFAALQFAQHKRVRGLAKRRLHALFMHVGESGHRVKPAAADDADLRLSQLLAPRSQADSVPLKWWL